TGIECFYRAAVQRDPDRQAELVLRANVLLAAYEQWRLEPVVQVALDPVARHLVEFVGSNPHHPHHEEPRVVVRRDGPPWPFRHRSPFIQWYADIYGTFLTREIMAWEGPIDGTVRPLYLGRGLPDPPQHAPLFPPDLIDLTDPATETLVAVFDHSNNCPEGR